MAEGIAKAFLRGTSSLHFKSAGLYALPGNPPSKHAIHVCLSHGIHIERHRAQPLTSSLAGWADSVFCMERDQCLFVKGLSENARVFLIGEGVPGIPDEIADPYGGPLKDYEQTFFHLTKAIAYHFGQFREGRQHDRETKAFG